MLSSYSKIYAVGHKDVLNIFDSEVLIEEKIDGSQFSFGLIDDRLVCRSRGKEIDVDNPEKMFSRAIGSVKARLDLMTPGWIYRGEYLEKPHHNTLAYNRTPLNNIIIFDIDTGNQNYIIDPIQKSCYANFIGYECVPAFYAGMVKSREQFTSFLERESILGGVKIEGVVIKNYSLYSSDKKTMMAKYVSESFKETHQKSWKERNPTRTDILDLLTAEYATEARWVKAIQHLREGGLLEDDPRDIGKLVGEIVRDVKEECEDEIKRKLFAYFWPKLSRTLTRGMPEWYKQELMKRSFD